MFVVVWVEHLRDGKEDGAKVVATTDEALKVINHIAHGFAGANHTFQLFKLGSEVKLKQEVEKEKEKVVVKERIVIKLT